MKLNESENVSRTLVDVDNLRNVTSTDTVGGHQRDETIHSNSLTSTLISITVIILFTISYLASMAARISVEKDWVVCLCEDDISKLSTVNTNVRTLDLVCNVSAPFIAGQVLYYLPYSHAGFILGCWVLVSTSAELILLHSLYNNNTALHDKVLVSDVGDSVVDQVCGLFSGWRTYFGHSVRDAGLGLALLYMTVLGFDSITWGYCKDQVQNHHHHLHHHCLRECQSRCWEC